MHNIALSMSGPAFLGIDTGNNVGASGLCTTPRTPDVLNSVIAMTNPLDYHFQQQQINHADSQSSCSESPLDSPAGSATTPSVQQTRTQLIKASLRLSLESKRKLSSGDSSGTELCGGSSAKMAKHENGDSSDDDCDSKSPQTGLTPEDEDRRRRRRERNKIAATKCRMKKRERTSNLVYEAGHLENQNVDLKSQVRSLKAEVQKIMEMMDAHMSTCVHPNGFQPLAAPPANSLTSNINVTKYLSQLGGDHHPQTHPIPPVNTIKYCLKAKQPDIGYAKPNLPNGSVIDNNHIHACLNDSNGYCKTSPTEVPDFALSPDSGFMHKSSSDLHIKTDYIPNGDNSSNGDNGIGIELFLKSEHIDAHSPYTTMHSADRFLFDGTDSFEETLHNNNHKNHNNNVLDFCHNYSDNNLIHTASEILLATIADATANVLHTEFTDLDSGVTSYTNAIISTPPHSTSHTNGGCLA